MKTWKKPLALSAALALGIAACDDSATEAPVVDEDAVRADVALVAADGMFQDLAHMQDPAVWAGIGFAPEAVGIEVEGTKTFSRTVTFYDAAGAEMSSYDELLTASLEIVSDLTRVVTHTFWSADITRHREMQVTGLEGEEIQRTWNGTGNSVVARSRHPEGGVIRTYDMTGSSVIDNVVKGVPRSEYPYPLSGSITRTVHVVITEDGATVEERDFVSVITFDGDNTATMSVDGESWEVNLDDRNVRKRFGRKG